MSVLSVPGVPSGAELVLSVPVIGVELGQTGFTIVGAVLILMLLMGSGFFSSSEIAMFSLTPYQIDAMVEQGKRGAKTIKSLKSDPHRLLVTILVGNNLVNITMSSISTTIVGFYFDASTAVLVSSLGITSMVLLFGESAPKSYAVEHTDSWARTVATPLNLVGKLLWPLITLFYYLTKMVNKLTPGGESLESSYVTREEIRNMIKTGEREGILDEEERQMIQRTLRFQDTVAKEVMTPRLDVGAISKNVTVEQAIEECMQSGHARLPVYDGSLDDVTGVFDIRDLDEESDYDETVKMQVSEVISTTLRVPESKNIDELLFEMREKRLHMVIVVDEFGATEGIVTIEDIVEEIVGEILVGDEEHPIEAIDDDEVVVSGGVNIDEVNQVLDINLPEGEEFETIAGFIFNRAGRLVEQGEEFDYESVRLRAEQVEDTRIQKVRVTIDRDTGELVDGESPTSESEVD